jgi:hypothetical protein
MTDSDAGRRACRGGDPVGGADRTGTARDVLASRRRRIVLDQLLCAERPVTVTELARHVAVSETDLPPGDLPVSLLEHDPEAGEIRLDTDPTAVRRQLAAVRDQGQTTQA